MVKVIIFVYKSCVPYIFYTIYVTEQNISYL